jgi:hypothetical protein
MARLPDDFVSLLPKLSGEPDLSPIYYLWVFDPVEDKVHVEHNEGRHRADHIDHGHLAERVSHPERLHGFAYRIKHGWRITNWEHRPVDDPHVVELVRKELRGEVKSPASKGSQVQARALR